VIRLLGVVLIWGGCTFWGIQGARSARQQLRALEDIGQALELLEQDLSLNRRALPELLDRLSKRNTVTGRMVFCTCKRLLEEGRTVSEAWEQALKRGALSQEDQELLRSLSHMLGQYDVRGQEQALRRLSQEVTRRCEHKREAVSNLVRVYYMLGITAGGFLSLTLM